KIVFKTPTPFWADPFCGIRGMIIPKHLFQAYKGDKSREAPTNLKPVGTGPYRFADFKPGDIVRGEIHTGYHIPNRPFFDQVEMKGGGEAILAARAVIQTGEYDYAWNLQVEDEILKRLEQAGWKRGSDGVREKDGKKLKLVYQTSINPLRQKTQQIVKQAAAKAGFDMELTSVTASVYFSSDAANPDTYGHFYTDIQMYTTTATSPDPEYFMNQFTSWEVAAKDNKWQGRNITRWRSEEYDKAFRASEAELDPVKRAALFIRMNDLAIQNVVVIPVVFRPRVAGIGSKVRDAVQSGWDSDFWALAY